MLDLAYACLIEQFEGDARSQGGYNGGPIADARQALDDFLLSAPAALTIPPDELALRRALGVA